MITMGPSGLALYERMGQERVDEKTVLGKDHRAKGDGEQERLGA